MKILCVAQYYPLHIGGLEVVAERQAVMLAKAGHEVTVMTTQRDVSISDGVGIRHLSGWHILDRRFGIPFVFLGMRALKRMFDEVACADIVHVHDVFYMTSWFAYICAAIQRKRIVVVQHVGMVEHPSAAVRSIQKIVYATIGSRIFARCAQIIVYNAIVQDFLLARGVSSGKILKLGNGIDVDRFRPVRRSEKRFVRGSFGLPEDRTIVLFAGRFVPKKGFAEVFAARDEAYDLAFAGSGDVPEAWRSEKNVHILGPISPERMPDLYRAADIFIAPTRRELFTLAMQEACASGLAVVVSDEPEYLSHEIDRENISFITPDVGVIRAELQRIASNAALRERMGKYARSYALEHFDARMHERPILDLYEKRPPVVVTTSWDDGHILDIRLALKLREYGIKGTFYVSPHDREIPVRERLTDGQIVELAKHFEIGAHTLTHPHLTRIPEATARFEIRESKRMLEAILGSKVTSFCYPAGYFAPQHQAIVRELGFKRARTVARYATLPGADAYAMQTSFHAYRHWSDVRPMLRALGLRKFLSGYLRWDEAAIALFDKVEREGGVFHLWGHSWEIDRNRDWPRLERVLAHIGNRANVIYATNAEVVL